MARQVDITFKAKDQVSPVTQKISKSVDRLPDQFGKSATALNMFGNASTAMGGKVADAANKVAGLGTMIASGGPVGIAIAGLTVAVGAATKAWDDYNQASERNRALMELTHQTIGKTREAIVDLETQLKYFGKDALEVQIEQLKEGIKYREEAIAKDQASLKATKELGRGKVELVMIEEKLGDKVEEYVDVTWDSIRLARDELSIQKEKLGQLQALADRFREKADAEDRAKDAAKRSAAQEREALADLREHAKLIAAINGQLEQMDSEILGVANSTGEFEARLGRFAGAARSGMTLLKHELTEAEKQAAAAAKQQKQDVQELEQISKASAMGLSNNLGYAFAQIAVGAEGADVAMSRAVISSAKTAVMSYAASGAAAAAFSQAGIPILGPFLAITAASTMFGIIEALMADIPEAAKGLRVKGGYPGVDSVPVMMQQDEVALSVHQTKLLDRFVNHLEAQDKRGGGFGAGSGGLTQINHFTAVGPLISAETMRATRAMRKLNRRAASRGH